MLDMPYGPDGSTLRATEGGAMGPSVLTAIAACPASQHDRSKITALDVLDMVYPGNNIRPVQQHLTMGSSSDQASEVLQSHAGTKQTEQSALECSTQYDKAKEAVETVYVARQAMAEQVMGKASSIEEDTTPNYGLGYYLARTLENLDQSWQRTFDRGPKIAAIQ
jgi:hypothetical protein